MKGIRFAEGLKVLPLTAPVAFTTSAVASQFVDMKLLNHVSFLVMFGVMTSDSTDTVTVTVEACPIGTTTDSDDQPIAFRYRLSSAVGTDNWGAVTTSSTSGVALTADANDAMALLIDVDPAEAQTELSTARWLRVVATPSAAIAAGVISVVTVGEPRYPGAEQSSST